ncbi:sel1 repeat family protein [Rhizobium deserti]|uniref:Sel1 repeat family protein n=1 Tax=Rhizobium deserti TaxID=2547961 RepID=A0A4R5UIA3_9HYPH|nr:tetratricopeptide repeat protein [Rhizobium deserti]TDK35637.1 sel1 repeat family protein [Rhizobium deserti]
MRNLILAMIMLLLPASNALGDQVRDSWEWFNAAEFYQGGQMKGRQDLKTTARYFRVSAEKGNAVAAFKLGEIYENGIGLPKDPIQAFTWYMRAAARNDKDGQLKVGWCYQKGIGVQPDPQIAAIWYRISAENKNVWAYHMLAFMLADGQGMKQDLALARRYFEISLPKTNDHWAKWKLASLLAQEDPKRARNLLKEAAAAGNAQAAEELRKLN